MRVCYYIFSLACLGLIIISTFNFGWAGLIGSYLMTCGIYLLIGCYVASLMFTRIK